MNGEATTRADGKARWVAFAFLFALGAVGLRALIHWFDSPFRADLLYAVGVFASLGSELLLGAVLALPILRWPRAAVAPCATMAALLLLGHAAAAHYHAVFHRLPGLPALEFLKNPGALTSSLRAHAPIGRLVLEACAAAALPAAGTPWLAGRLSPWLAQTRARGGLATAAVTLIAIAWIVPSSSHGRLYYGSVEPWAYLATTALTPPALQEDKTEVSPTAITPVARRVQNHLGTATVGNPGPSPYPYCRTKARQRLSSREDFRPRSVVLLILEGVSMREVESLDEHGRPRMPHLRAIAEEGVSFQRFFAAGDRSSQALVSIMSGVTAATHRRVLTHAPLVELPRFPALLSEAGLATAYFHGSDLSFEQQRLFLRRAGFGTVVEPPLDSPRLGWGAPDEVVFAQLRDWITTHRNKTRAPYFATLFTLSTHDPYVLPDTYEEPPPPNGQPDDPYSRFARALGYLDRQLGQFYTWYRDNEAPHGTLLLITGDHAPRAPYPGDPVQTTTGEFEYRFRVPLIVVGAKRNTPRNQQEVEARPGGHHDVAQTILGQLGSDWSGCFQGRDLLGDAPFPEDRWVVSLAGEALEFFFIHDRDLRWMLNLRNGHLALYDRKDDPYFRTNLTDNVPPQTSAAVRAFVGDYLKLGYYLNIGDHFVPPPAREQSTPIEPLRPPLLVAHRGHIEGPDRRENSLDAVEQAARSHVRWVELDVQITRDRVPVLFHDAKIHVADGSEAFLDELTLEAVRRTEEGREIATLRELVESHGRSGLNFCIELKPQRDVFLTMDLVRTSLRELERLPDRVEVIVDSFSRTMLRSVEARSQWQLGYDLPQRPVEDAWLDYAQTAGFDWVYVRSDFYNQDLAEHAHARGLRVMVYTVNDPNKTKTWTTFPDGVISDRPLALLPALEALERASSR